MADHIWIGNQVAVPAVYTLTVGGTFEAGDLFNTTIQNTQYQIVATTDNDTTAGLIEDALTASTQPEFTEATYSVVGSVVTATVKPANAGKPILFLLSTTETGGGAADLQTYTLNSTVSNQGPNVLSAGNLNTNDTPTVGDSLFFQESSVDVKWLLDDWAAEGTLALLDIQASYTGKIGLPKRNKDTTDAHYNEYRPRYLDIRATNVRIGDGEGSGSGRIMLNLGSVQTTVEVYKTAATVDDGYHPVRLLGTHANNTLIVYGGKVDVAPDDSDASTFQTIRVESGTVRTGAKVTHGAIYVGSQGIFQCNLLTADINRIEVYDGGTATITGSGNVELIYVRSGTLNWRGSGTIGAGQAGGTEVITVGPGGKFDASKCPTPFDVEPGTVIRIDKDGAFYDPNKKGTYTGVDWDFGGDSKEMDLRFGHRWDISGGTDNTGGLNPIS